MILAAFAAATAIASNPLSPVQLMTVYRTGNTLLRLCTSGDAQLDELVCLGYIEGVADAMADGDTVFGARACVQLRVEVSQLHDLTVNYLQAHPESRQADAAQLVAAALSAAYPCPA